MIKNFLKMYASHDLDVLSDVHIFVRPTKVQDDQSAVDSFAMSEEKVTNLYKSRFVFKLPLGLSNSGKLNRTESEEKIEQICVDADNDGDLLPVRSSNAEMDDNDDLLSTRRSSSVKMDDDGDLMPVRRSSSVKVNDDDDLMPTRRSSSVEMDDDGDLMPARWSSNARTQENSRDVIVIEHCMSTPLGDVGLQVWQGSLLMCDFILSRVEEFQNCVALELGGGLGLGSITMAMIAKMVFCTDVGDNILSKCKENVEHNSHLYGLFSDHSSEILVRELDWTKSELNQDQTCLYSWRKKDEENLSKVSVIFAADCIYDNNLTDAVFKTLIKIMNMGCRKTAYISMERRYNFTLSDLDVTCKEYDYFHSHLVKLTSSCSDNGVKFNASQVTTDFPQYFDYKRVAQLELWQITMATI